MGLLGEVEERKEKSLAWMAAKYKYNPKDIQKVPHKVHQAGQPWDGWVLGIVRSYKRRTGT